MRDVLERSEGLTAALDARSHLDGSCLCRTKARRRALGPCQDALPTPGVSYHGEIGEIM